MKRKVFKVVGCLLLLLILIFLFEIFYPRIYDVPQLHSRANEQYWNLSSGSRIGYVLINAKNNTKPYPIIYLHGGPGGHITERNIQDLSPLADSGYNVYLYDQVGSGQSARLNNINEYTVERHIKDLNEIIKKIGAQKVILIGQSWGAILATLFGVDYADKIDKLILTSPGPIYPINKNLSNIQQPDSIHLHNPFYTNAEGNAIANNIRTKAMAYFATTFGSKIATDEEADNFETYLSYEVNRSTVCNTANILKEEAGDGFYANVMTYRSLTQIKNERSKIKKLTISVLIVKGECDNQKWGFTNEYLQLFKNHQLVVIPNAGHFIYVEQPQLYINSIQKFLSR